MPRPEATLRIITEAGSPSTVNPASLNRFATSFIHPSFPGPHFSEVEKISAYRLVDGCTVMGLVSISGSSSTLVSVSSTGDLTGAACMGSIFFVYFAITADAASVLTVLEDFPTFLVRKIPAKEAANTKIPMPIITKS